MTIYYADNPEDFKKLCEKLMPGDCIDTPLELPPGTYPFGKATHAYVVGDHCRFEYREDPLLPESRAYTVKEMREMFLDHAMGMARYWAKFPAPIHREGLPETTEKYEVIEAYMKHATEGFLHSLLVTFDGCSADLPAFDLIPHAHPDDKAYHQSEGTNWWEEECINGDCHLHDMMWKGSRKDE